MQPNDSDTPPEQPGASARAIDGRALAKAKREQMRLRAGRIRRTIATGAAGLFATAFLGIYVQLASGHDPALVAAAARSAGAATCATASTSSSSATGEEATSSSGESSSTPSGESSSSSESEASSPSSVTTSQS